MTKRYPEPHEIRGKDGEVYYRCRVCWSPDALIWYRGTSCPVCSKPECREAVDREWASMTKGDES
jgi:hypothetical protein